MSMFLQWLFLAIAVLTLVSAALGMLYIGKTEKRVAEMQLDVADLYAKCVQERMKIMQASIAVTVAIAQWTPPDNYRNVN